MRFCWDYWHVPSQYTLHRTQAASYFDEDAFAALTDALTAFGQRELGCRAISPPWLSFYVDGCEQRLHADVPQGPFAFVLSLTRWEERRFSGGETSLLRPETLDYWRARLGRSPLSFPLSSGERSASSRACGGEQARLRLVGRARAR